MNPQFLKKAEELVRPEDQLFFLLQRARWSLEGPFLLMITEEGRPFYFNRLRGPEMYVYLTGWKLIMGPGEGIWQGRICDMVPPRKKNRYHYPANGLYADRNNFTRESILINRRQFMRMYSPDLHPGLCVYLKLIQNS